MRRYFLIPAVALALAAPLAAQTVTNGQPVDNIGPLGKDSQGGAATAVAQQFMTPTAVYLQSFTFYLTNSFLGDQLLLDASIYQFSGGAISGPALFQSALFSGPGVGGNDDVPVTFGATAFGGSKSPLNIALAPNVMYAFVLSTLDDNGKSTDGAAVQVGLAGTNTLGGLLISFENDLTKPDAFVDAGLNDLAFSASVTSAPIVATPEPASLMLMATGLAGVGGVVARRRRKA